MKNLNNITEHIKILKKQSFEIEKKTKFFSKDIIKSVKKNKKLLIAGNGGSAADAQHIATELTVRMSHDRKALPCIALTTDTSALTAIGNDFEFKSGFAINKALFAVLVLLYPLVDLLRVFVIRIKNGNSPFQPDQNHIHHLTLNYFKKHFPTLIAILSMEVIILLITKFLIN